MVTTADRRARASDALKALERRPTRVTSNKGEPVELPEEVAEGLVALLEAVAAGDEATVVRHAREITTQEAADMLNVSRPYLIKLLDAGEIPHRKVGTHRRVILRDLLAYRETRNAQRRAILDEMTREAEELGLSSHRQR